VWQMPLRAFGGRMGVALASWAVNSAARLSLARVHVHVREPVCVQVELYYKVECGHPVHATPLAPWPTQGQGAPPLRAGQLQSLVLEAEWSLY